MPGDDTMILTPSGRHAQTRNRQTRNGPMSRNGTTPSPLHETALQARCKADCAAVVRVGMGHACRRWRAAKQDCAAELCAARIASLQAPCFRGSGRCVLQRLRSGRRALVRPEAAGPEPGSAQIRDRESRQPAGPVRTLMCLGNLGSAAMRIAFWCMCPDRELNGTIT